MSRVLGIVYRAIETDLIRRAGRTRATAKTGAVTLIQRFGSALNLNIHFHMLFLDGVYLIDREPPVFRRLPVPRPQALEDLVHTISQRVGAFLEREGLLVRNIENSTLQLEAPDQSALNACSASPGTGSRSPQPGQDCWLFPAHRRRCQGPPAPQARTPVPVARRGHRPALTAQGNVRYTLKTPFRDGTTHIILEPLDFIARLAALVPKPRVNLTRFHGVFAPNSSLRRTVV